MDQQDSDEVEQSSSPSRRGLLGALGAGGAGLVLGGAAGALWSPRQEAAPSGTDAPGTGDSGVIDAVSMFGEHQAGIDTEMQDRMCIAAFDLTTKDVDEVVKLMKDWSSAIGYMTQGLPVGGTSGASDGNPVGVPIDTGEAVGLTASHLTVTVGFGRSLFVDADGKDRFGLKSKLPEALIELPHFSGDMLEKNRTGGDLVVQACADDPQVAVHAVRNLARQAFGTASVRWTQVGFGRTASTSKKQATPRNLFGFKDGTNNLKLEDKELVEKHVWVSGLDGEQKWLNGGTYLVARRIRMHIEVWDSQQLGEQELVVGRSKSVGAPLSGGEEFTDPDFGKKVDGEPAIAVDSHVALAHPDNNEGVQMLRRSYNYADGADGLGRLDAGLFFIAFVVDPRTHYVPMQSKISKNDLMQEYLRHTGSGLFAVPRGLNGAGGYLGQELFEG